MGGGKYPNRSRGEGEDGGASGAKRNQPHLSGLRLASLSLNLSCTSGVSKQVSGLRRKSL
jgi:hypothetical protein